MRFALLVVAALAGVAGASPARAGDVGHGRQLFQLCAACHGPGGAGVRALGAPAIAGLPAWYVGVQLDRFRQGIRGYRVEDAAGLQMRPMARALRGEGDVRAVAAYVAALPPARPPVTVTAHADRGRALYAPCAACHGERGGGNEALAAPPLAGQSDWYLAAQLEKFRLGWRGTQPRDPAGTLMRPMALALPDARAVHDVVAYIATLGGGAGATPPARSRGPAIAWRR